MNANINADRFYPPTIGWHEDCYKKDDCVCQRVVETFCIPNLTCVQDYAFSFTDIRHCPNSDVVKVSYEITIWYEACECSCKPSCNKPGCSNVCCKPVCRTAVEHGAAVFRDLPFETGCCDFYVPLPDRFCSKQRCGEIVVSFVLKLCKKDDDDCEERCRKECEKRCRKECERRCHEECEKCERRCREECEERCRDKCDERCREECERRCREECEERCREECERCERRCREECEERCREECEERCREECEERCRERCEERCREE